MQKLYSTRLAWLVRAGLVLAFLTSLPGASAAGDGGAAGAVLPPGIRVTGDLVPLRRGAALPQADNLGVYNLADVADAFVSAQDPNFQGGREPSLMVGLTPQFGYRRWSYLRFDHEPLPDDALVPVGESVAGTSGTTPYVLQQYSVVEESGDTATMEIAVFQDLDPVVFVAVLYQDDLPEDRIEQAQVFDTLQPESG